MSLSHFIFSGTSYEQGISHGEALKDSIKKNIDVYLNRFETEAGISKNELIDNARIYLAVLREQNPEYVNGINGISESSNLDILEIALLNLRYELLYTPWENVTWKKLLMAALRLAFSRKLPTIITLLWDKIGIGFQMWTVY